MDGASWIARARARASALRRDVAALAVAARDPRTPWVAKVVMVAVVAYAVSPIDLIPDPIPVLGLLDDLVLLPLGIALAVRLVPDEVLADARRRADLGGAYRWGRLAAYSVVAVWVAFAVLGVVLVAQAFGSTV